MLNLIFAVEHLYLLRAGKRSSARVNFDTDKHRHRGLTSARPAILGGAEVNITCPSPQLGAEVITAPKLLVPNIDCPIESCQLQQKFSNFPTFNLLNFPTQCEPLKSYYILAKAINLKSSCAKITVTVLTGKHVGEQSGLVMLCSSESKQKHIQQNMTLRLRKYPHPKMDPSLAKIQQ